MTSLIYTDSKLTQKQVLKNDKLFGLLQQLKISIVALDA